jgi:hypothetical protein
VANGLAGGEQQIPFGNDRQKSKCKSKGKSFALLRMTTVFGLRRCANGGRMRMQVVRSAQDNNSVEFAAKDKDKSKNKGKNAS